ncbi:His Kinase A (phospho-acceptor) domain-containing protein [Noviherbaspirillum humi]|uniref:histidine kinase n=2 Tax=Noviherbaspirillum humi TaxID=1688639 RepID=A0A239DMV0_9BURK|nr:His Kinase A (phospho-acceptor) domain-containing protein [Noviherbaspirillum humi]
MMQLREAVLSEWERRARSAIAEAGSLPHPLLINTMPTMYANLAQALSPAHARADGEGNTVASEHGGERARLTNYHPQSVVQEYQLLRWTIFDVLGAHQLVLDQRESGIVNAYIDRAIREAVAAYALVQSALRERFVAALTHDLRNPLTTANVAAELIRQDAESPRLKDLAERILEQHGRMDRMIQDLLDSVVFQSGERLRLRLSRFDLGDLVVEVCRQSIAAYGPRMEFPGGCAEGWWDREALKRALENLVGNAVKYGDAEAPIHLSLNVHDERVQMKVHNSGPPIPEEQMESVFQVFRRTEAAREGAQQGWGIGLPYVRSVAESHGGSIGVDSGAERGTTFAIDIPLDARPFQNAPTL